MRYINNNIRNRILNDLQRIENDIKWIRMQLKYEFLEQNKEELND